MNNFFKRALAFFIAGAFLLPTPASATWSIVILDQETKTIGIAGASCSYIVYGIGEAVPGKGAAIAQAASNMKAKEKALAMIRQGASPEKILATITNPSFDIIFSQQQYAVLTFKEFDAPGTFNGDNIPEVKGAVAAPGISVQGNTLAGEEVLSAAFSAASQPGDLPSRLMAALSDGAKAGGDNRCGEQRATSAFIMVVKAGDILPERFLNLLVYGLDRGSDNAVETLQGIYLKWKENNSGENTRVVCWQRMPAKTESYGCE